MSETKENIIKDLSQEGAKKPISLKKSIIISSIVMIGYLLAVTLSFGLREDFFERIFDISFQIELFLILGSILSAAILVSFLRLPDLNQQSWIKIIPLIFFFLLLSLLILKCIFKDMNIMNHIICDNPEHECFLSILVFSIIPTIFLLIILKIGATTRIYSSGMMIGIASGSLSYLALRLIHETENSLHLFIWHFTPAILVILLSIFFAKRFIKKL